MSKLIVITGASSGIGEATAKKLSAEGYSLFLLARRIEKLEALNLPNTLCRKVDVTDVESFKSAIEEAEAQFGPVDGLINNAGVMLLGNAHEQNPQEWKTMFDVNVMGLLNGIHVVLAKMKARKSGTVINISSIAGRKTFPSHAAYCGTKFAVHAITENIREEVADDSVRMITIAPGAVETELLSHTTSDEIKAGYEDWKEGMGGVIAPEDIANAISYAYNQPQNVCVREIVIAATRQPA
ncbi:putative Short-chain dehydrogenase/reductase SDR [Vibrio nigripulchritudo SFn27]|uniref:Putative Short-chain dehydrogenase/reductase SDR n=1 Tax=Vibrio nigripulchritudo TaxID=28173 RepID=U4KAG6_9VIBR|nr:SDR family oxidoreductase [Vibrio nigripulchritudo]CCN80420.1 putative Short-chain dehydrogenase/reductase SDR [Vibrio nigripulchritudo BLFn1]CCN88407.1 putative Short-chain dehydrogenase/reductase SDR [Vibrio nigripulchritudo SFn27]CCN92571.1 putative Short-chain dehydrogenase/reductase SDR [Vibrio nigripulchritudo ENn2]CCO40958.1 putative Short-chain dehydrogenase/reductase SDR [Vibrio nigripulchritudo SFn135]CCO50520.1 putative Short-chain dehydrogenase/reductase SDR [Vibrio nigripulchri